jgi:hypothetical protein
MLSAQAATLVEPAAPAFVERIRGRSSARRT